MHANVTPRIQFGLIAATVAVAVLTACTHTAPVSYPMRAVPLDAEGFTLLVDNSRFNTGTQPAYIAVPLDR